MNGATEKPTPRQRALLNKLMLSSTFSAEQAHRTAVWMASPGATKERATEVIDDALSRIEKPGKRLKRHPPTARPSITRIRPMAMGNAHTPQNDIPKTTPRPMGIRPMANLPQNPHPNQRPKVRQLLHLKRSRQHTA